jgi:hypothetical protein
MLAMVLSGACHFIQTHLAFFAHPLSLRSFVAGHGIFFLFFIVVVLGVYCDIYKSSYNVQ